MTMTVSGARLCYQCETAVKLARRAKKARTAEKRAPRIAEKKAKRATRNAGTAALRGRLLDLTDGLCERCRETPLPEEGHMHHTEGGGGRVQRQHIGNVTWLCGHCHDFLHKYPAENKAFRIYIREKREKAGER